MSQVVNTARGPSTAAPSRGRLGRLVLIAWWLLVVLLIAVLGQRPATLSDLMEAVDAGQASEVHVTSALPNPMVELGAQDVRWRQGPWIQHAVVVRAGPGSDTEAESSGNRTATVMTTSVTSLVHERDPGVSVEESDAFSPGTSSILGWEVPAWLQWSVFAALFGTLVLIVSGPEPWRATRWAWAWTVLAAGPIGALAFAVLSGPTPVVKAPRDVARRLRGGWAFVLLTVLGPFIPVWR